MGFIKSFLAQNPDIGRVIMVIMVFLVTFLFGLLVKHFTKKITNETTRKSANSILYYIAIGLGFLTEYVYAKIIGVAFRADYGLVLGACGIGTNEGIKILGYYAKLFLTKIQDGTKITKEELLKPLPSELIKSAVDDEKLVDIATEKKAEEVVKTKAEVDPVKKAQEQFDNILK